eukprot:TRINITY_DN7164_c0_g1_i2.p1 TRINITY_DN7164_c0_g1~~TRINITY_DN7164_c0_g1_i2.p1  ORF type:complete len:114 (-),score=17.17 TRINITY_DN7164_c0_g1_i2:131-472(-)
MLGFVGSKRLFGVAGNSRGQSDGSIDIFRLISGSIGGGLAWTMVYPFDVVRNLMMSDWKQQKCKGMMDCIAQRVREQGIASFYRGLSYSLARALPLAAVTLTSYDFVLRHLSG